MHSNIKYSLFCGFIAFLFLAGCSGNDSVQQVQVDGKITVADSVDSSNDYGGISVTVIKKDSANVDADTLFNAVTNKKGEFSGVAKFAVRRQYPMLISRNGQNIGRAGVILAQNDAVHITAQLPDVAQTIKIKSREHEALKTYQRVGRSFHRVNVYARSGRLTGDSLVTELKKWPDIYWQIYKDHPKTLAGELSAKKTIELLNQLDKQEMMKKIQEVEDDDNLVFLAATYGKKYMAETQYLDKTLSYLDDLKKRTDQPRARMRIEMERIDLLYDSARTQKAGTLLQSFQKEFGDYKKAAQWAKSVKYDLSYLSPGDAVPDFAFSDHGKEISREKLKGHPYLLEITSLSNPVYQQQFDRTDVIYSLYKNYDLNIITIPLDTSQVTVDAFFEERVRPWPVAPANAFSRTELVKRFNINTVPTRFLVDRQGRIVRRYVGREYQDVIQGIRKIIKNN